MIKLRPSLPSGYSLAGLPAIEKPLHSDDRCELYSLAKGETVLLLVRRPTGPPPNLDRLVDWWTVQPKQLLEVRHVLSAIESPPKSCGAVLALKGRHLEGEILADATQDSLRRLFHAMLDAVDRGRSVQMYPDFNPSLSWLSVDETTICSLLPLDGVTPPEIDQVRVIGRAFYRLATGIELAQLTTGAPALVRWSKFAGEELSRIIDRCMEPAESKASITSLHGLNHAMGRVNAEGQNPQEAPPEIRSTLPSPVGQGLDKVAGMHALKDLLRREVVEPVRNPEPYRRYGLSIPNGILLYGPPGCGKTYIARQLAQELGHYFVEIIPSELASPYVHQSVMKIRELFDAAAEQAPAVVFIDEFEALVPPRGELGGHQQHKAEEVNEFLAHLNGCAEKRIFVIAATNQPERIDSAVRRTGRLDKLIYVGPPDAEARREMLSFHLQGRPVADRLDLEALAQSLTFYSASDIRFLVNEAARHALKMAHDITDESFRFAMARIQPSVTPEIEAQYRSIEQRGF